MSNIVKWREGAEDDDVQRILNAANGKQRAWGEVAPARRIQAPRNGTVEIPRMIEAPRDVEIYGPRESGLGVRNSPAPPVLFGGGRAVTWGADHPPLELPRWCTIHDGEMSLARYLWRNGVYVYSDSIEVTPAQKRRYSADNAVAVPAGFCTQHERCAICGKWTPEYATGGAVTCPGCAPINVCYGNTTPDRYFECRASCGFKGFLQPIGVDRVALVPGRRGGNFGTKF